MERLGVESKRVSERGEKGEVYEERGDDRKKLRESSLSSGSCLPWLVLPLTGPRYPPCLPLTGPRYLRQRKTWHHVRDPALSNVACRKSTWQCVQLGESEVAGERR